jgi:hypothetical protein
MIPACARIVVAAKLAARSHLTLAGRNGLRLPCRIWDGAQSKGGKRPKSGPYGSVVIPGIAGGIRAHVVAAWVAGKIPLPRVPAGMHLDHECERTLCIEETHLVLRPKLENLKLRWARPKGRGEPARIDSS